MKYAAIKRDLHKGSKEANEGTMMLNMARGLIEASHTIQASGGDQKEVLKLQAEADNYLESAERQFKEAAQLAGWIKLALEVNRTDRDAPFID